MRNSTNDKKRTQRFITASYNPAGMKPWAWQYCWWHIRKWFKGVNKRLWQSMSCLQAIQADAILEFCSKCRSATLFVSLHLPVSIVHVRGFVGTKLAISVSTARHTVDCFTIKKKKQKQQHVLRAVMFSVALHLRGHTLQCQSILIPGCQFQMGPGGSTKGWWHMLPFPHHTSLLPLARTLSRRHIWQ